MKAQPRAGVLKRGCVRRPGYARAVADDYIREKLTVAFDCIDGSRPRRDEVESAYISGIVRLDPGDFPTGGARAAFESIVGRLRKGEASASEGPVASSIHAMTDLEVEAIAVDIRALALRLGLLW